MLKQKLNPGRFESISGKWAALVGCILNERYTDPAISQLCVTTDGFVLAMLEGDIGFNEFIGSLSDFNNNWSRYLEAANLDEDETRAADALYERAIH